MSRKSTAQPEFRLYFGYPTIVIECDTGPARRIPLDRGAPLAALRGVATEIRRRRGRLMAFLPEGEVWSGRTMDTEAAFARRTAAAHLDVAPGSVALTLGPIGPDGARSVAAVRRSTLTEARDFLARANLRPSEIAVSGSHDGFIGAPVFRVRGTPTRIVRTAVVSTGLAASLLVMVWAGAWSPSTPEPQGRSVEPVATLTEPPAFALASATMPPSVGLFSPAIAYTSPPPLARPASLPVIATVETLPDQPPARVRAPVVLASRTMPEGLRAVMPPTSVEGVKVASLEGPKARPVLATAPVLDVRRASTTDLLKPQPRPAASVPTQEAAVPAKAPAASRPVGNGPRARPAGIASAGAPVDVFVATLSAAIAAPASAATPAAASAVAGAGVRPAPRPATAPVRLASLSTAAIATSATATNAFVAAPPEPRRIAPARASTTKAAPKPAAPKPAVVQAKPATLAQPVRVQTVSVPAQATSTRTQRVVNAPAPQPTRTAAVVSVAPAPSAAPKRSNTQPQQTLGRNSISLIGVFGTAAQRHALIQLPNGQTQRVRQGDEFQGVRVTAVANDSVHLRAQGRDTVIRLPE